MRNSKLARRFDEILEQIDAIEATKRYEDGYLKGYRVNPEMLVGWMVKAKNLLSVACGDSSEHYRGFVSNQKNNYATNHTILIRLKAVVEAAQEDYNGGYCNTVRNLVQAEVFSSELDQAQELLTAGYLSASAVIAGVVLETTLRGLCDNLGLPTGKLDKMNADLAKAGQYNLLVQKRITALADIRNNAAHGHPEKFTKDDVTDMIAYIEGFVTDQL